MTDQLRVKPSGAIYCDKKVVIQRVNEYFKKYGSNYNIKKQ